MQSIFRPPSRREALGEHSGGDRHDGGLKMGWAKPSGCGDIYGYRLPTQSWRGSEAARGDERVGRSGWVALPPVVLVQSLDLGPILQASDSLSPRASGSARRPFLKFAPEPWGGGSGGSLGRALLLALVLGELPVLD
jgi:hypothetical protein